jgi:hypothetical protein
MIESRSLLMGCVSGAISDILPAKTIVDNMVNECVAILNAAPKQFVVQARM